MKPIYPYGQGNLNTPHLHDIGGRPVYGDVLFVDSTNGNGGLSANEGTKRKPFLTIDSAINQATEDTTIYVGPGHAESMLTALQINADVVGLTVIGCGNGTRRPTLTYDAAAGEFGIGADNVRIENIRFVASFAAVVNGIEVADGVDYFTIKNCDFLTDDATNVEFNDSIRTINNNTGGLIENCLIDQGLGDAVNGILADADCERLTIKNCRIQGDFSTACITNDTAICTEVLIQGNILQNGDTTGNNAQPCIELGASTGIIADNYCMDGTATDDASIVATGAVCFNNVWSTTVGSGVGLATAAGTTLTA